MRNENPNSLPSVAESAATRLTALADAIGYIAGTLDEDGLRLILNSLSDRAFGIANELSETPKPDMT